MRMAVVAKPASKKLGAPKKSAAKKPSKPCAEDILAKSGATVAPLACSLSKAGAGGAGAQEPPFCKHRQAEVVLAASDEEIEEEETDEKEMEIKEGKKDGKKRKNEESKNENENEDEGWEDENEDENEKDKNEKDVKGKGVTSKRKGPKVTKERPLPAEEESKSTKDVQMRSLSPQPAYGSSKASGGTFRGRQDTNQLADMEEDANEEAMPLATGLIRLYVTSSNPTDFNFAEKNSIHSEEYDTVSTFAPIFKKLQRKFPSISKATV
ncbi:hypothetical protein H1R20_g6988, partial [Candolleomyces eurysporus]